MPAQGVAARPITDIAQDVRRGLSKEGQKELPSKYFYDEVGSALFEAICHLPEYGLSRAGVRLLSRYAPAIASCVRSPVIVAELGCGSGRKTRLLLEVLTASHLVTYHPIEISNSALAICRRELGDIASLRIESHELEYLEGLRQVGARRRADHQLMVLFLGSTIGNFDRLDGVRFLEQVRQNLVPGDLLLLGTDLEKPVSQLLLAYDDPLGVTAAFNLNLLARLNRELDADFQLDLFRHVARYNHRERRIEMHLRSVSAQTVKIPGAGLAVTLDRGETIWTESSHKYNLPEVVQMAGACGFRCDTQWVDEEWPFALSLLVAS